MSECRKMRSWLKEGQVSSDLFCKICELKRPRGYIFKVLWYRIFLLSIFVLVVIFHNKFDYPSHKRCFWHSKWRLGRALNDFSTRYRLYSSKSKKSLFETYMIKDCKNIFLHSQYVKNIFKKKLWTDFSQLH